MTWAIVIRSTGADTQGLAATDFARWYRQIRHKRDDYPDFDFF